jgi:hypothetical protein
LIHFEPSHHWAIRDFDVRIRKVSPSSKRLPISRVTQKCSYRAPGASQLAEVQFTIDIASRVPKVSRWTVKIDDDQPSTLAEAAYKLPAFGVSEPPLPRSKTFAGISWFWFVQAGFIVLVLALLFRRRAKK